MTTAAPAALSVHRMSKTFGGRQVLADVSADLPAGKITALLGHNGSGKSTLIKILAGFHAPDEGARIELRGAPLGVPVDPHAAHQRGLRFVHQNPALVGELTIADNVALAQGFSARSSLGALSRQRHRRQAEAALARLGVNLDPRTPVGDLSATERMLVAIARAVDIADDAAGSVLVLDEPTAYLPPGSVDQVLALLDAIRGDGGTVVYVTHRIDEVMRIADEMIVLRDGAKVEHRSVAALTVEEIAEAVTGRAVEKRAARARSGEPGATLLRAEGLGGDKLDEISFSLRRGEVLGVAGLVGCGRSELTRLVAGEQRSSAGTLEFEGERYRPKSPREAIAKGVVYVPPDRQGQAVIDSLSLRENVTIGDLEPYWSAGHLGHRAEKTDVARLVERFGIKPPLTEQPLSEFSGGNQQKAVLAKVLRLSPTLLVVDEPTQGVDIEGKREIAAILTAFADQGGGILIGSSDFDEIAEICDRVLVLDRGRQVGLFQASELDEQRLVLLAADRVTRAVGAGEGTA